MYAEWNSGLENATRPDTLCCRISAPRAALHLLKMASCTPCAWPNQCFPCFRADQILGMCLDREDGGWGGLKPDAERVLAVREALNIIFLVPFKAHQEIAATVPSTPRSNIDHPKPTKMCQQPSKAQQKQYEDYFLAGFAGWEKIATIQSSQENNNNHPKHTKK